MKTGLQIVRMVFGAALRDSLAQDVDKFDRVAILKEVEVPMVAATRRVLAAMKG